MLGAERNTKRFGPLHPVTMMYRCNLDVINESIKAQEDLNRIAYHKAAERRRANEEARNQRMQAIEAKKAVSSQAAGAG